MSKKIDRAALEKRAERIGLELSEADRNTRMDAASNNEPIPKWQLSDGKNRETVQGFRQLSEVAEAIDQQEIMRECRTWSPDPKEAEAQFERRYAEANAYSQNVMVRPMQRAKMRL